MAVHFHVLLLNAALISTDWWQLSRKLNDYFHSAQENFFLMQILTLSFLNSFNSILEKEFKQII